MCVFNSVQFYQLCRLVCSLVGKESACSAGDLGLIPGLGRSPGEGKDYPLQYSGLENSIDCSLPGSCVHGILQARILEWVAISFSRGSSQPRYQTQVSCIAGRFFTNLTMREALSAITTNLFSPVLLFSFGSCQKTDGIFQSSNIVKDSG